MQIAWRRNPKTVGWARRIAIALLVAAAVFTVTLPVAFLLFMGHNNHATPNDPQNMLGALTAGMLVGVCVAVAAAVGSLMVLYFLGFYRPLREE